MSLPIIGSGSLNITSGNLSVEAMRELGNAYLDYKKTVETEYTKRCAIDAWKTTELQRLANQHESLKSYFSHVFGMRAAVLTKSFDLLDQGIKEGQIDYINIAMDSMVNVIQTSPLKDVEKLLQDFRDPNANCIEW
ncbi:hypothetical protein [Chromatium okenii]|jgi:hypothetical protein|uniref:hypothetical protein n=1 Tax=Chromatium okenii TaxID=61644 RepID=UPI0026F17FCB|nr:hypothetical protein [Chromatium okenii]MBV5310740.1 hypothetical protein [Chromatium okenii]